MAPHHLHVSDIETYGPEQEQPHLRWHQTFTSIIQQICTADDTGGMSAAATTNHQPPKSSAKLSWSCICSCQAQRTREEFSPWPLTSSLVCLPVAPHG